MTSRHPQVAATTIRRGVEGVKGWAHGVVQGNHASQPGSGAVIPPPAGKQEAAAAAAEAGAALVGGLTAVGTVVEELTLLAEGLGQLGGEDAGGHGDDGIAGDHHQ